MSTNLALALLSSRSAQCQFRSCNRGAPSTGRAAKQEPYARGVVARGSYTPLCPAAFTSERFVHEPRCSFRSAPHRRCPRGAVHTPQWPCRFHHATLRAPGHLRATPRSSTRPRIRRHIPGYRPSACLARSSRLCGTPSFLRHAVILWHRRRSAPRRHSAAPSPFSLPVTAAPIRRVSLCLASFS